MNKERKLTVIIVALLGVIAVLIAVIFGMLLKGCGEAAPVQEATEAVLPTEETAAAREDVSETLPPVTEPEATQAQQEETAPAVPTEKPAAGDPAAPEKPEATDPPATPTNPPATNPPAEDEDDIIEGEVGLEDSPFEDG